MIRGQCSGCGFPAATGLGSLRNSGNFWRAADTLSTELNESVCRETQGFSTAGQQRRFAPLSLTGAQLRRTETNDWIDNVRSGSLRQNVLTTVRPAAPLPATR
jgi:hypothetical protein